MVVKHIHEACMPRIIDTQRQSLAMSLARVFTLTILFVPTSSTYALTEQQRSDIEDEDVGDIAGQDTTLRVVQGLLTLLLRHQASWWYHDQVCPVQHDYLNKENSDVLNSCGWSNCH